MNERQDLDRNAIRQALEEEREALLAASDTASEDRQPVTLDQQSVGRLSRMDALQVQAMATAMEGRRRQRLLRIEAALKRLAEGDFGICEMCDEDIPKGRLEIDPTVTRCVDCSGK